MHQPSVVDTLPQLSGVRMVWFSDYWDGPLDGDDLTDPTVWGSGDA